MNGNVSQKERAGILPALNHKARSNRQGGYDIGQTDARYFQLTA